MRRILVPAIVAAVLAVGGCASTPEAPVAAAPGKVGQRAAGSPKTPEPEPKVDTWQRSIDFVSLTTADDYERAEKLVEPGSAAARYIEHQAAYWQALLTHGQSYDNAGEIVPNEQRGTVLYVPPVDGATTTFGDFVHNRDGLLTDFSTGGEPVSDKLWTQSDRTSAKGASVSLVSAYKTAGDTLVVVLEMSAREVPVETGVTASYKNPDGLQMESGAYSLTPDRLQPGARGYLVFDFAQSEIGGDVEFEYWPGNDWVPAVTLHVG